MKNRKSFISDDINKKSLIKKLVKLRINNISNSTSTNLEKIISDYFSSMKLTALPETTILMIIQIWIPLNKIGVPDKIIIKGMESHRTHKNISGELPDQLTISSYIKYRINLERKVIDHSFSSDFISKAIQLIQQNHSEPIYDKH